jgi:hypothetical protein
VFKEKAMEFRFNAKNKSVKVNCSKILIQEIIMYKGNFKDVTLFFSWQSIDNITRQNRPIEHEFVPESFQRAVNPENSNHIKLLERWPNGWHTFHKNTDGVVIRFQSRKETTLLSDIDFTLVFETK